MNDAAVTAPHPELLALEPATVDADDGQFILGIRGTGFTMHSKVFFNYDPQATGMLGQDLLSVPVHPGLYGPCVIEVRVVDDLSGMATNVLPFTITEKQDVQEQKIGSEGGDGVPAPDGGNQPDA